MSTSEQVKETIADTLNLPLTSINNDSSAENIDAWDSLAQVNLMIALEQTFDIQLEVEDFMDLTSAQAIIDYIDKNT